MIHLIKSIKVNLLGRKQARGTDRYKNRGKKICYPEKTVGGFAKFARNMIVHSKCGAFKNVIN